MEKTLVSKLYRAEFSKIVAVLCSRFGSLFMETAEDIASDTFLAATETWAIKGVPENPVSWLYRVARNKALNHIKHDKVKEKQAVAGIPDHQEENAAPDIDLSPRNITDSQLQMLFFICDPILSREMQISLALRILCGFRIEEIARALLTTKGNINKRLFRAKESLRAGNISIGFPPEKQLASRLDTVLLTLYLLFNEGYYSAGNNRVLRQDLCLEALRLACLLTEDKKICNSSVYALLALMCFQASRFDARLGKQGELILYEDQDSSKWDTDMIDSGNYYFLKATAAGDLSKFHLEAAIGWWHTHQADSNEKWEHILRLYNQLLIMEYSPVAALNRAYAYSKVYGKAAGISEAEKLHLAGNFFYQSLMGELYTGIDNPTAIEYFGKALQLAGSQPEKKVIMQKIQVLNTQ